MSYDVNYAKEFIIRDEAEVKWFWMTVEAETESEAIYRVKQKKNPKYIISICSSNS